MAEYRQRVLAYLFTARKFDSYLIAVETHFILVSAAATVIQQEPKNVNSMLFTRVKYRHIAYNYRHFFYFNSRE